MDSDLGTTLIQTVDAFVPFLITVLLLWQEHRLPPQSLPVRGRWRRYFLAAAAVLLAVRALWLVRAISWVLFLVAMGLILPVVVPVLLLMLAFALVFSVIWLVESGGRCVRWLCGKDS